MPGLELPNGSFLPRRRQWHPTLVLLPGKSHGRRSLVGCSPWGREELDMTEWFHFHFSLLCIGEGNGNPLQCSCLENPRDGVAQSQTRLKWLTSSSFLPSRWNCSTDSLHYFREIDLYIKQVSTAIDLKKVKPITNSCLTLHLAWKERTTTRRPQFLSSNFTAKNASSMFFTLMQINTIKQETTYGFQK